MPRELKKRGRREKRKREGDPELEVESSYTQGTVLKIYDEAPATDDGPWKGDEEQLLDGAEKGPEGIHGLQETPFYGLLDEDEQDYFKRADALLEANQFGDEEERTLFLENVFTEAKGKELKIACSQSCSRLLERLILLASSEQLKTIFRSFSTHFLNLVQHRFASHCCEMLFRQSAPVVSAEISGSEQMPEPTDGKDSNMEACFLSVLAELQEHLGFLMTDPFASHPFRILLTIFAGLPLDDARKQATLQSKRKEKIGVIGNGNEKTRVDEEVNPARSQTSAVKLQSSSPRFVPASFEQALIVMMQTSLAGLEIHYLRSLAHHPIANPVLQIMLEIELTRAGSACAKNPQSLLRKLICDDDLTKDTESAAFITSLLYDAIGSRLLEVIIMHAPGKTFKAIYRQLWRDKLGSIARNETAAFVMLRLIERLSADDLSLAVESIVPHMHDLIERNRAIVITTLIKRCRVRQVDVMPMVRAFAQMKDTQGADGFAATLGLSGLDMNMTNIDEGRQRLVEKQDISKVHNSLLIQTMLEAPGPMRDLMNDLILSTSSGVILSASKDRSESRIVQAALTCPDQSAVFLRSFLPRFIDNLKDLACDNIGSHVVDAIWTATMGLNFLRQRFADELIQCEVDLRACYAGRAVWRNWRMDLYKAGKRHWAKDNVLQYRSNAQEKRQPVHESHGSAAHSASLAGKPKTKLELARERYVKSAKFPRHDKMISKSQSNNFSVKGEA